MHNDKVLIVDDNELILALMKNLFQREFSCVIAACTGEEAVDCIRKEFYGIVVLDINLPGLNGWGVLECIKKHSPKSKVIIVSSDSDEKSKEHARRDGVFEFIEKPFDISRIQGVFRRLFQPEFLDMVPE